MSPGAALADTLQRRPGLRLALALAWFALLLCAGAWTGTRLEFSGDLRRFLVGPVGQEITGVVGTPDGRTLFVNVQHPGENTRYDDFRQGRYTSHWPDGAPHRPRSACLVITRADGGVVGGGDVPALPATAPG